MKVDKTTIGVTNEQNKAGPTDTSVQYNMFQATFNLLNVPVYESNLG